MSAEKAKPGPVPRTPDGKVDLSGIWSPDRNFIYDIHDTLEKGAELPIQPWAEKLARERLSKDDPEALCLPTGVPRQAPYPWRIVQTATHMFFLFEGNIHSYRQIFLDGRKHPDDPDPTWYGHSTARWEGDTLVVDSVGFRDTTYLDTNGLGHSAKLHLTERFKRTGPDTIEWTTTVEDSLFYVHPFTFRSVFTREEESVRLMIYDCENEKDNEFVQSVIRGDNEIHSHPEYFKFPK